MSAEENKEVVRRFWGVWEEGNIGLMMSWWRPTTSTIVPGCPTSRRGLRGSRRS